MSESPEFLRKGEKIIWSGKPAKTPFMIAAFAVSVFGLLWLSFSVFALWLAASQGGPGPAILFLSIFVLIGFGLALGPPTWQIARYKNTKYIITDQRLISQTGAIGLDTRFVDLDKIQEVSVNIGFLDKITGTGSLTVVTAGFAYSAGTYPVITALKNPYAVQKILHEAAQNRLQENAQPIER